MEELVKKLIQLSLDNNVGIDIKTEADIGCNWIIITLSRGDRRLRRRLYYYTTGEQTMQTFEAYNPPGTVDIQFEHWIDELDRSSRNEHRRADNG